jgi:hypothetical protein
MSDFLVETILSRLFQMFLINKESTPLLSVCKCEMRKKKEEK